MAEIIGTTRPYQKVLGIPVYSGPETRENDEKVDLNFINNLFISIPQQNLVRIAPFTAKIGGIEIVSTENIEFLIADEAFVRDIYFVVKVDEALQKTTIETIEVLSGTSPTFADDYATIRETAIFSINNINAGAVNLENGTTMSKIFVLPKNRVGNLKEFGYIDELCNGLISDQIIEYLFSSLPENSLKIMGNTADGVLINFINAFNNDPRIPFLSGSEGFSYEINYSSNNPSISKLIKIISLDQTSTYAEFISDNYVAPVLNYDDYLRLANVINETNNRVLDSNGSITYDTLYSIGGAVAGTEITFSSNVFDYNFVEFEFQGAGILSKVRTFVRTNSNTIQLVSSGNPSNLLSNDNITCHFVGEYRDNGNKLYLAHMRWETKTDGANMTLNAVRAGNLI